MKEFKTNDKIELRIGGSISIKEKLGEGGQGVVYRAELDGKYYALKWYTKPCKREFYENLNNTIKIGPPTGAFLWPMYLTEWKDKHFGYIMELRPPEYHNFSHFLLARSHFAKISAMINAALQISNAFRELHRQGYSYQDINDGNFFINPQNGNILICDNDNIAPYGKNLGIAGKCRYMAPEVVLRKNLPNANSDRFSLAVILFMLLFNSHPLEGRLIAAIPCLTDEMERRFYGTSPVFIFDPENDANRPVMGIHTNAIRRWPLFPQLIRDSFIHAFSSGHVHNPNMRNPENEWQKIFLRLRDQLVVCTCATESFLGDKNSFCPGCGNNLGNPLRIDINRHKVLMFPGQKIYAFHIKPNVDDFSTVAGEVIQNKNNPDLWGIRNISFETWIMTLPDGVTRNINNNEVVPVFENVKILFAGGVSAEIY